jgi:RNA polymerase sigma-70 factor, ECF subfamily
MAFITQDSAFDPDLGVLERIADGDNESFGVLVGRHQERLQRLCFRMLGDLEEARDTTQDVFLKVYDHAGSYRPEGKVSTWLHRIAVNACLNKLRRRRIVRFFSFGELTKGEEGEEREFDPADQALSAPELLAERERQRLTRDLIDALPANQKAVLVLAKFENFSQRQIAETLQITEGAVESRLVRAMKTLVARAADAGNRPLIRSTGKH